jgi:hypothetical protein
MTSIQTLLKYPTLRFFVLNPPVEIVENAWFTESNQFIPAILSNNVCNMVNPIYTTVNISNIFCVRYLKFSLASEDNSTLDIMTFERPREGKITSENKTTPTPPSQWVDERQKSNPAGRASMSTRIVLPVVV